MQAVFYAFWPSTTWPPAWCKNSHCYAELNGHVLQRNKDIQGRVRGKLPAAYGAHLSNSLVP